MRPLLVALIALLALASPASAAQLTVNGNQKLFTYRADTGEANRVTVTQSGTQFTVTDPGAHSLSASTTAVGGCTVSGDSITCPGQSTFIFKIETGDLDDTVS